MIVAPGLVETHWHMWNTLLRSMSGGMPGEDRPAGYFSVSLGLGRRSPTTTTTRARCWPAPRPSIPASPPCTTGPTTSAGPPTRRLSCARWPRPGCGPGTPTATPPGTLTTRPWTPAGCAALHRDWDSWSGPGAPGRAARLTLGMACRGPGGQQPGHAGAARGLPAGDGRRPRTRPPGHRARLRAAVRGRADRRAGRRGPARAGPAGGARQQRDARRKSPSSRRRAAR